MSFNYQESDLALGNLSLSLHSFFQNSWGLCPTKRKTIKTSGFPRLAPMSAAGLPHSSLVSDGVSLGHAMEQMHKAAELKAGSQAEPQTYSENLDES